MKHHLALGGTTSQLSQMLEAQQKARLVNGGTELEVKKPQQVSFKELQQEAPITKPLLHLD